MAGFIGRIGGTGGTVDLENLEGAFVTLSRAQPSAELVEHFQDTRLQSYCGMMGGAPDLARLEHIVNEEEDLYIYAVAPSGGGNSIGYAGVVFYDGPPYFFYYTFNGEVDFDWANDCLLQVIPILFEQTEEPQLYIFVDAPVDDDLHALLVDGGFDYFEDCPTIDNDKEAAYILERHTYEAYYAESEEDDGLY